jgi:hypothetical protein
VLGALEGVGTQIEQLRQAQLLQGLRPDVESLGPLFHEHRFPIVVAETGEIAVVGPIEELTALVRALAGEQIALVVAVEVNAEALAGGIVALKRSETKIKNGSGRPLRGARFVTLLVSGRYWPTWLAVLDSRTSCIT